MSGYVGQKAKNRRRNTLLLLVIIIVFIVSIYFYPEQDNLKNLNSTDSYFPNDEDIDLSESNIENDKLELLIFEKEQKIIFRDQQIKKLSKKISVLKNKNDKLESLIKDLNKNLVNDNKRNEKNIEIKTNNLKEKLSKIELEAEIKLKKLNDIQKKIIKENIFLKKEKEKILKKNLDLNKYIKSLELKIDNNIERIKELEDISHH